MTTPRLIKNLPPGEYHAIRALSASMALSMVEECPLLAWTQSAFNPNAAPDNKPAFDIGSALHLAVLEPGEFAARTVLHHFDDYRTAESKRTRDDAYASRRTPLKPTEADMVERLRASVMADLDIAARLARPGDAEVSLTWEWNGVECKARPDFLPDDRSFVIDLKSAVTAHPDALGRKAMVEGWHVRASWYLGAVEAVTGTRPERYLFAVAEKKAPHIAQLYEMDERALARGDQIIKRALDLFAECQRTGVWPKYRQGISTISLPGWSEFHYADREEAGEL